MLPTERGLLSSQRPLIDMLPNTVGRIKARLHSQGHMHAAPRSQFPPLVSCHSPSCLPFAFTPLHRSYLCHSQSLATSRSLSTLCHQSVTHSTPFHFYLPLLFPTSPCQPVSNCAFAVHLVISLVTSLPFLFAHSMHFALHPHFYLPLHIFLCLFFLLSFHVLPISVFTCAVVGINVYQLKSF